MRLLGVGRGVVGCGVVEGVVFGSLKGEEGEGKWRGIGSSREADDAGGTDEEPSEEGGVILPPSPKPPKPESNTPSSPRLHGQQRALHREKVRQAARRGCAFGFLVGEEGAGEEGENRVREEGKRRKVEAVQNGRIVEASFAKGEFGVRWVD